MLRKLIQHGRHFFQQPVDEFAGWRRTVRYMVEFGYHCGQELIENKATQMAAALTYYTLFSILPTLVLMLVVMHSFLGDQEREQFKKYIVNSVMEIMGDTQAGLTPAATLTTPAPAPETDADAGNRPATETQNETVEATDAAGQTVTAELTPREQFLMARDNLDDWVQSVYSQLENTSFRSIGFVGILVFIYAATALLRSIENSFNVIYQSFSIKSIIVRLPIYYMVITLGPIVILAGQYAQQVFFDMITSAPWIAWLAGPLAFISPLVAIWLVFFIAYALLPNSSVHVKPAAIGSFIAALLWVVLISSFKLYVARYSYANLYGALALLPLFLFLLWISWLIVLFGLQVTYTMQHLEGKRLERESKAQRNRFVDPGFVLPMMAAVGKAFEQGETVAAEELARRMNLPGWAVSQMAQRLVDVGLLHQTQDSEAARTGLTLGRPAAQITVADLLDAAADATMHSRQLERQPGMNVYKQLHDAGRRETQHTTLADMLNQDAKTAASC